MAAAIFNNRWPEKGQARSAGLFATEGQDAAFNASTVLNEHGIEIEHQSSQVKKEDMDWATHILTMTTAHKKMLMNHFPEASDKIFTLKEYVRHSEHDFDVMDPFGGDLEVYQMTFTELDDLIGRIFKG